MMHRASQFRLCRAVGACTSQYSTAITRTPPSSARTRSGAYAARRPAMAASPASWPQRRTLVIDAIKAKQLDAEVALGVQEILFNDITEFAVTSSPPAYAQYYISWLAEHTGGHWPTAVALAVLSTQPVLLPLMIHFRMRSISVERALRLYTTLLIEYQVRLKATKDYGEAWRAYRAKRDMLKWAGFWLPHKWSLGFVEVPLAGCFLAGAALVPYHHGNLGGWLWLSDFGAADPTILSPLLFFTLYTARVWVGSPHPLSKLKSSQVVSQSSMAITASLLLFLQGVPAIVFWLGIMHNLCVLPVVMYLRRDAVYRSRYVPLMSRPVQEMVLRDAEGKQYALPHATKVVDRFAPDLDKRPLLLADFDPDKVPAPVLPALDSGEQRTLTNVTSADTKRLAVEEARKAVKPKVRRK